MPDDNLPSPRPSAPPLRRTPSPEFPRVTLFLPAIVVLLWSYSFFYYCNTLFFWQAGRGYASDELSRDHHHVDHVGSLRSRINYWYYIESILRYYGNFLSSAPKRYYVTVLEEVVVFHSSFDHFSSFLLINLASYFVCFNI